MYLKLLLSLFPGNARTLQCFSLIYARINFYAVVILCINTIYILSPTTTINVVLNSVHSDSPSHAPISSWRTVLTSKTIFLPEVLLLVFLLTEVCWVLVLCRRLSPAFISEAVFSGCVAQGAVMLSLHAWGLVSWLQLCCCVSWRLAWPPCYSLGGGASLSSLAAWKMVFGQICQIILKLLNCI